MSGSPGTLEPLSSPRIPPEPLGPRPEIRFLRESCSPQRGTTFNPKNAARATPATAMATQKPFCFSLSTSFSLFLFGSLGRRLGLAVLFAHGKVQRDLIAPEPLLVALRQVVPLGPRRFLRDRPGQVVRVAVDAKRPFGHLPEGVLDDAGALQPRPRRLLGPPVVVEELAVDEVGPLGVAA